MMRLKPLSRRTAVLALSLLLGACATPVRERPAQFWSGRLGLQVQSEPPQSLLASFELQGNPQTGALTLLNPIGGVLARLSWTPQQATLERGNERWTQPSVEALAQRASAGPEFGSSRDERPNPAAHAEEGWKRAIANANRRFARA